MAAVIRENVVQAFEIVKEEDIAAPIEIVFEAILEQMGPLNATPGTPMPMVLEARPGGRWFRDLGGNAGHLWGLVQAIKPPTLLEISGPLIMSTPALNNLQYRLTAANGVTHLRFVHRAMGWIEVRPEGINEGWQRLIDGIREGSLERAGR